MLKFMRKVPAGTLLIPMLISALFNTFLPGFFAQWGGISKAFFTTNGINYIVGLICLCSSTALDFKVIKKVIKKQGVLLFSKIIVCLALSMAFMKVFGMDGVLGISTIAFVAAICSINPSLYLALTADYGTESDQAAFGLTGLLCVPAFPLLIFSISMSGGVDWNPIISTLIPIVIGIAIGNLDKELASFLGSSVKVLTIFMGWSFGAGINIISAFKAGLYGVIITVIFYVAMVPILYFIETKVLKHDGVSSLSMCSIAGLSVAIPSMIAEAYPAYSSYAASATAQIALGVVLTSVITPILVKALASKKNIQKNIN